MVWLSPAEREPAETKAEALLQQTLRAKPNYIPAHEAYCRFLNAQPVQRQPRGLREGEADVRPDAERTVDGPDARGLVECYTNPVLRAPNDTAKQLQSVVREDQCECIGNTDQVRKIQRRARGG